MNNIIFTGTASGFPSPSRAGSSIVIQIGSKLYQFDAGEGFSSSALKFNIKYNQIEKIFISHSHPDHIAGLFMELQMMYLAARKKRLDIYVPGELLPAMNKTMDLFYLFQEKFAFPYNFKPIRPNPIYRNGDLGVYAYLNKHLVNNERIIKRYKKLNKMQSYSFVIIVNDKKILYSADIDSLSDLTPLIDNVHTIIADGLHVEPEKLLRLCFANKIKRTIVTHLDDKAYAKPDKLYKIARKLGVRNFKIAHDGLKLRI
jgi:ribonuclease BN (tRNA processing enzyme)